MTPELLNEYRRVRDELKQLQIEHADNLIDPDRCEIWNALEKSVTDIDSTINRYN